ncbi:YajQ family cyclic di-GMP-binding protein [Pleionea sp. CnH1-48]|uniref:YajQ family cyclic di-GMP-binding protein n=1 Tax=Pleionea sp. CnH1-48 TaxID=2954494 RepID=UPI00209836D0|nr:YajQ family cyclic di-GMP-binding protein [Pleionea sp. CnH1-48]MCO7227331.1 YajQ family cyclic di-GMP-binding protein [Pleionea sp. CnH1-48]
MPSFDLVSEIELSEVRNAVENANRELDTRFDFRGIEASFEFNKDSVKLKAEAEFQLKQMLDILRSNCVKRKLDPRCLDTSEIDHTGKTFSRNVTFKQGIDKDTAKKIVKMIKESKLKVQAAIQGEQVRVTGKKRDDLQAVMALVRDSDLDQPFQFNNFRD